MSNTDSRLRFLREKARITRGVDTSVDTITFRPVPGGAIGASKVRVAHKRIVRGNRNRGCNKTWASIDSFKLRIEEHTAHIGDITRIKTRKIKNTIFGVHESPVEHGFHICDITSVEGLKIEIR